MTGPHRIRPGDLYLTDYAQPNQVRRCTAGIMLSRQRVRDAVGDVSAMAGTKFGAVGLAATCRGRDSCLMFVTFDRAYDIKWAPESSLQVSSDER